MKKILLSFVAILVVLSIVGALFWKAILASMLGLLFRMSQPEPEPNRPLKWQQFEGSRSSLRPNVILILTDDMGFNDVSFFGGGLIPTPNIDNLAHNGITFSKGYAGSSVCAPSRAMIMTGRYATRYGFEFTPTPGPMGQMLMLLSNSYERPQSTFAIDNAHQHHQAHNIPYDDRGMPTSEQTLADIMQLGGYHTVQIGKWHLGRSVPFLPQNRGFDESLLMASGLYLPIEDENVVNAKLELDPIDRILWSILTFAVSFNGSERFIPDGYLTDYFTNEAVNVIEANQNRPFFLYLAHWGIHTPLQATKEDYEAVSHLPTHREKVYAGMIRSVDRSIGKIVAKLEALDMLDNTLIIFTSDNGGANYVGLPNINKPYRGWKLTFFEGGTHVPFFMHWPDQINPAQFYDAPVSHLDLLPTIAAAANVKEYSVNEIDGVNLLPYIKDPKRKQPPRNLVWRSGEYQSILSDGWKLHVSHKPKHFRLFNMINDPLEKHDLAESMPEKVAEMKTMLVAHNKPMVDPLWPAILDAPIWIDKPLVSDLTEEDDYIYWQN